MEANAYHKKFTGMLVGEDGTKRWFIDGAYGREDGLPAVEYPDGTQCWYVANPKRGAMGQRAEVLHREGDLPAVKKANGDLLYYKMGKLHREGEQPAIIRASGVRQWWDMGTCKRAVLADGTVAM